MEHFFLFLAFSKDGGWFRLHTFLYVYITSLLMVEVGSNQLAHTKRWIPHLLWGDELPFLGSLHIFFYITVYNLLVDAHLTSVLETSRQ